jgi:Histidine kinase-, DNA gyrase B-, and HSP90-like ATPase
LTHQSDNGENHEDHIDGSIYSSSSRGLLSPSSTVKIDDGEDNYSLRFVVTDYGQGINERDFRRIFEPFRQASAETEFVYGGTGLGLAISAKLVHGLGGTISVDSEEGLWSQYTVDLPLVMGDKPVDMVATSARLKDTTIFLILDNDDLAAKVIHCFKEYQADYVRFRSTLEMKEHLLSKSGASGTVNCHRPNLICLTKEELFDKDLYASNTKLSRALLLTYGPLHTISESQGHYRSLIHILPSVLMNSMAFYREASRTRGYGSSLGMSKNKLKA